MSTILKAHKEETGLEYDKKIYVGDGTSDLCASLVLNDNDVVFCRKDYRLHQLIEQSLRQSGSEHEKLKASHIPWTTGHDICDTLSQTLG